MATPDNRQPTESPQPVLRQSDEQPLARAAVSGSSPAVAKLAASVAHELNNPLDAVLRFVSLAQRKAKGGDYADLDRYLAEAQFGLQRMTEILRELMNIGRQTDDIFATPQLFVLSELIAHAARTTASLAEQKNIRVVLENSLPAQLTPRYDLRLSQVLANLLKNALEAAPERTTVRLAAAVLPDQTLLLTVEDWGTGISQELLPRLFTPFVSSKPQGVGNGLGLSISREIVVSLGGSIRIENRTPPGVGAIATVILPLPS